MNKHIDEIWKKHLGDIPAAEQHETIMDDSTVVERIMIDVWNKALGLSYEIVGHNDIYGQLPFENSQREILNLKL